MARGSSKDGWDGSSPVTLKVGVSTSNATTLYVKGVKADDQLGSADTPPDTMDWSFGHFPLIPAAGSGGACPPSYCLPENTTFVSGCGNAPNTSLVLSVPVTTATHSLSVDVTSLLKSSTLLKIYAAQVNTFVQNATVTRIHAYPAPALLV